MNTPFLIERETLAAVVQYLSLRPWREVHQIMPALMNLQPAPEQVPTPIPAPPSDPS
jgi:hypothetical protein